MDWVAIGRVLGPFGVRGGVRVKSWLENPEAVLTFPTWWLGREPPPQRSCALRSGRVHTKGITAFLEGIESPETAKALSGQDVWVPRTAMPALAETEAYWFDLPGLRVVTLAGEDLGSVQHLFATGANDVIVVQGSDGGERLIPFIPEVVLEVDTQKGVITVSLLPGM